ncbi:hypothetical protein I352_00805 [Cryptococcus deuterogattii MMRL2647]|nr:hypothetical protein I352_00805 [Cryptococcus deuterogattii MMRL2647]
MAKRLRLHMISKHKYPTQYFWSITNHGINEIARQDGLGFSLIRPKLDLNSAAQEENGQGQGEEKERGRGHHGQPRGPPSGTPVLGGSLSRSRSRSLSPLRGPSPAPCGRMMTRVEGEGEGYVEQGEEDLEGKVKDKGRGDIEMEDLTRAMSSSSLSFLPRGVRKSKTGRARGVKLGGRGLDM